jgi:hypothetical protein
VKALGCGTKFVLRKAWKANAQTYPPVPLYACVISETTIRILFKFASGGGGGVPTLTGLHVREFNFDS